MIDSVLMHQNPKRNDIKKLYLPSSSDNTKPTH